MAVKSSKSDMQIFLHMIKPSNTRVVIKEAHIILNHIHLKGQGPKRFEWTRGSVA